MSLIPTSNFSPYYFSITYSEKEITKGEKGEKRKELSMSLIPTSNFSPYYFSITYSVKEITKGEKGEKRFF